jgi:hypothetical protein
VYPLYAFLALVGVLAGLRLWPILIHTLVWRSGLATATHDASSPSEEFKGRVTRLVLVAAGAWFCIFASVTFLVSYTRTYRGGWVALFSGVTFTSCFVVANYFLMLRRLQTASNAAPHSEHAKLGRVRVLLKRASSSLVGHIVLFQLFFALPMFILFVYLNYSEGTLTFSWGVWIAFVSVCGGLFMALFLWFTLSRWFVYLRRDTDAMRALLARGGSDTVSRRSNNHSRGP